MADDPRHPDSPELPELAALADGTMDPGEAAAMRARIDESPELAEALERQRRAIARVAAAQRRVDAPADLRVRVDALRGSRRRPSRAPRRFAFAGGLAVAAAAALVAFFLIPGGISGEAVLAKAAATHARPATDPPPRERSNTLLDYERLGVTFPTWQTTFAWRTEGARHDRVEGRDVYTVTYRKEGERVGYSVLSGDRIAPPDGAAEREGEGSTVRVFERNGRTIVVFDRRGRTCVLSGVGVPEDVLVKLATWKGNGTLPF